MSTNRIVKQLPRLAAVGLLLAASVVGLTLWQRSHEQTLPDVLFVVLDTTRADHLPFYGYGRDTAPTLSALAAGAVVFERAFATAPWTVPSHASMFTGEMPGALDIGWHQLRLRQDVPTMAESFARAGYATAGISQNRMLDTDSGFTRGFTRWANVQAGDTVGALRAALASRGPHQPLFLFVNVLASHLPYNAPAEHQQAFVRQVPAERLRWLSAAKWQRLLRAYTNGSLSTIDLQTLTDLYDAGVHWADRQLGDLLATMDTAGLNSNLVVVVASDHGENLGDHGLFDHQLCIYNSLLHVPLLIYAPGRLPPQRITMLVSLKDLWKTIAEIAALPGSSAVPGVSMLAASRPLSPVVAEYDRPVPMVNGLAHCCPELDRNRFDRELTAVQEERFKLIVPSTGGAELYDLEHDPGETENVLASAQSPEALAALARLQLAAVAAAARTAGHAVELNEADRQRLRALGYLVDGPSDQ
jgi:arylsulfatase A-like enzyme